MLTEKGRLFRMGARCCTKGWRSKTSKAPLFADDVALLASSDHDLQLALGAFAIECGAIRMRVSTSESEAMLL